MDSESLALALVISGVVGSLTGYLGALIRMKYKYAPPITFSDGQHVHAYDTMLGDGKGWRCGVCGLRKEG